MPRGPKGEKRPADVIAYGQEIKTAGKTGSYPIPSGVHVQQTCER